MQNKMEKLIISKQLADEVKNHKANIKAGIEVLQEDFTDELHRLRRKHGFLTRRAVSAYLLGGQEKVYEVVKEVWNVVWLVNVKEFIAMTSRMSMDKTAEITINTYDNFEEAQETAQQLNDSL